ncbi:MAG: ATP-binding protein [Nocardioidaceae bacterium]
MFGRDKEVLGHLDLLPDPRSASIARRWVRDQLRPQHADVLDSAELATSELVTNAILHAQTSIGIDIVDVADGVRVEIHDSSPLPLVASNGVDPDGGLFDEDVVSIGNGLNILSAITHDWGIDDSELDGKTVWFVPAGDGRAKTAPGTAEVLPNHDARVPQGPDLVDVIFIDAPINLIADAAARFHALRRELKLLTLGADSDTTSSARLQALAKRFEAPIPITVQPDTQFDDAVAAGMTYATLRYTVDRLGASRCGAVGDLLDLADQYCHAERLLTLESPAEEARARRWLLDEFVRQAGGHAPRPWSSVD